MRRRSSRFLHECAIARTHLQMIFCQNIQPPLPAHSLPLPSAEKLQKGAPPCSENRTRSFLLLRIGRVANLSAQGQRRWPRPPHRIGSSFLLTSRITCQRRSETKTRYRKCASNRRSIPASLPRATGASNAIPLITPPSPKFSLKAARGPPARINRAT